MLRTVVWGVIAVLLIIRGLLFFGQPAEVETGGGVAWVWGAACCLAALVIAFTAMPERR